MLKSGVQLGSLSIDLEDTEAKTTMPTTASEIWSFVVWTSMCLSLFLSLQCNRWSRFDVHQNYVPRRLCVSAVFWFERVLWSGNVCRRNTSNPAYPWLKAGAMQVRNPVWIIPYRVTVRKCSPPAISSLIDLIPGLDSAKIRKRLRPTASKYQEHDELLRNTPKAPVSQSNWVLSATCVSLIALYTLGPSKRRRLPSCDCLSFSCFCSWSPRISSATSWFVAKCRQWHFDKDYINYPSSRGLTWICTVISSSLLLIISWKVTVFGAPFRQIWAQRLLWFLPLGGPFLQAFFASAELLVAEKPSAALTEAVTKTNTPKPNM